MKFLIDAQLPRRLALRLREHGFDAVHTLDLPMKNQTPDKTIEDLSLQQKRIVITKDNDFVDSFALFNRPYKLLLVSTGNIKNTDLEFLLLTNIQIIADAFKKHRFIEIDRQTITVHR